MTLHPSTLQTIPSTMDRFCKQCKRTQPATEFASKKNGEIHAMCQECLVRLFGPSCFTRTYMADR